jgi:hypothetical protein
MPKKEVTRCNDANAFRRRFSNHASRGAQQRHQRRTVPFDVTIPSKTTQRTFRKTDAGRDLVVCKDADDLFKNLGI